jgi:hypothetical protein
MLSSSYVAPEMGFVAVFGKGLKWMTERGGLDKPLANDLL